MKNNSFEKKTPAGRISKPFGSGGGLVLNLYDTFPETADRKEPLWVAVDGLDVPLYIESFERRGKASAVVAFSDIDTQRRAAEWVGREFFVKGATAPAQEDDTADELYLEDLKGWTAHLGGGVKGTITEFYDNDLNPLFGVEVAPAADKGAEAEVLIPAADELIEKIDERRREVWFSLPEGLLDVNNA